MLCGGPPMGRRGTTEPLGGVLSDVLRHAEGESPEPQAKASGSRQGPLAASGALVLPGTGGGLTGGDGGPRRGDICYYPHVFMHCGLARRPRDGRIVGDLVREYKDRKWQWTVVHLMGGRLLVGRGKRKRQVEVGVPSSGWARLILGYLSWRARQRDQPPDIQLGASLREWMVRGFGIKDDSAESRRLFGMAFAQVATLSFELTYQENGKTRRWLIPVREETGYFGSSLWDPEKGQDLQAPTIRLSGPFLELIRTRGAPVRWSALLALSRAPLASDFYRFLTVQQYGEWRHHAKVPKTIGLDVLVPRFGAPGESPRALLRRLAEARETIRKAAWPGVGGEVRENGVVLRLAEPHVSPLVARPDIAG